MNLDFKAVIFDMDGLLVDSEPVWATCETALLAARGKTWDSTVQNQFMGMRANDFLGGMIAAYGLTETVAVLKAEIVERMVALVPQQVTPRPGAQDILQYLNTLGVPCAIASSSPRPVIDAVVESQGWAALLPLHVSGDEVPNGKPAPDIYLETARQMGVAPVDCLALEDSLNGVRAAVGAGMTCIAVPDTWHTPRQAFVGLTPHIFDSLHDVLSAIRRSV